MGRRINAQQYLEQVAKLDAMINNKLIEQQQWYDVALGITANMEGERVQSTGAKQKMADAINKCVDMQNEINDLVDRFIEQKKDVIHTIEQLYSPIEYDVLHKRYIQNIELKDIADYYGKDYDWAKNTCKRGRDHVQVILNKRK